MIQLEQIIFNEKTKKESIILAAYFYIKQLYEQKGICDISCEYELNNGYAYIEAEYNGSFLCRW